MKSNQLHDLRALLDPFDACILECDGLTRVLHHVLEVYEIPHEVHFGRIHIGDRSLVHFWIEMPPYRVDYRARFWGADSPHGVFLISDCPAGLYEGRAITLGPLPASLIRLLAAPVPLQKAGQAQGSDGQTTGQGGSP